MEWPSRSPSSPLPAIMPLLGEVHLKTVQQGFERNLELFGTSVLAEQVLESRHRGAAAQVDLPVSAGNLCVPFVERFFDGRCRCSSDRRFEQEVTEQEAAERPIGADDLLIGESETTQRGQKVVDELQAAQRWPQPGCRRVSGGHERECGGMLDGDAPHRVRKTL